MTKEICLEEVKLPKRSKLEKTAFLNFQWSIVIKFFNYLIVRNKKKNFLIARNKKSNKESSISAQNNFFWEFVKMRT